MATVHEVVSWYFFFFLLQGSPQWEMWREMELCNNVERKEESLASPSCSFHSIKHQQEEEALNSEPHGSLCDLCV